MISTVLFDYDGVLTLDKTGSITICTYISNNTNVDFNFLLTQYRKFNNDLLIGKRRHEEIWGYLCTNLGEEIDIDLLYESFINTPINNQMFYLVRKLREKFKTGIITDNKKDRMEIAIKHQGLNELFEVITVSADVGSCKESEGIFTTTTRKLGVEPSECIFIDNNKKNLVVPNKLGMKTVYFDDEKNNVSKLRRELSEFGVELN